MHLLGVGEKIAECRRLFTGHVQNCVTESCSAPECGRLGHRLIVIESVLSRRTIVLCGIHFLEACRDCKELEVAEWNGHHHKVHVLRRAK